MKLDGANRLHCALEARYGERDPFQTHDGRRRGAWRCPACERSYDHAHRLTVALDEDGDPPECNNGCTEDAIWRALRLLQPARRNRTLRSVPPGNRTAAASAEPALANAGSTSASNTGSTSGQRGSDVLPRLDVLPLLEDQHSVEALDRLATQRHAAEVAAEVLGAGGVPLGRNFPCPIPGHSREASLYLDPRTGVWKMRCWCSARFLTLAEARAAKAYGDIQRISNIEASVWYRRLWADGALISPQSILLVAVADQSPSVRAVRDGFALLVGLRWLSNPGQPVTFSRSFAAAWCDGELSLMQAYGAICVLDEAGVIEWADADAWMRRTPKLWLPAPIHGAKP